MGIGDDLVGDLEQLLAGRALRPGALFRMAGHTSQCWRAETELASMFSGTRCLLLPSATIGLSLLLESLDLDPGKEVLIAPFGWLSNWSCISRAGLVPRFLPLDRHLQLDSAQVGARLSRRTGAVIVTHVMGRGQQAVADIAALCADQGVPLLEDIAQSFGVSVQGRRAGTFGVAAWCSLNHHKVLSTGDGGFVAVRDAALFNKVSALHDQGCVMVDGKRKAATTPGPGLSLRVNDLTAALLRAQLARFHMIRSRIWTLHDALADECERSLRLECVRPHAGDLPFTLLLEHAAPMNYPSLAESGWHVAANVPWLSSAFQEAAQRDQAIGETTAHLASISALGAGFVDPYYAVLLGLRITDSVANAPAVVEALAERLCPVEKTL